MRIAKNNGDVAVKHVAKIGLLPEEVAEAQPIIDNLVRVVKDANRELSHDEALLKVCRDLIVRGRDSTSLRSEVVEAIVATEQALSRFKVSDSVKAELVPPLIAFYEDGTWLQWPQLHAFYRDVVARVIELREMALDFPASREPGVRATELETLAERYSIQYDISARQEDIRRAVQCMEDAASVAEDEHARRLEVMSRCLRVKGGDLDAIDCALEIPFYELPEKPVSLDSVALRKFRFLDCQSFAKRSALRILELDVLPQNQYIAISYVWQGRSPAADAPDPGPTMTIKNATNADGISIEVLRVVCTAALKLKCPLLWLDGVCIIQGNDDDKAWQIQHMHDVYRLCRMCLIVPGGLSRLAGLDEETRWIHRAWTLQEAVAPPCCYCLFAWAHGNCILSTMEEVEVVEVEPETAAVCEMMSLMRMSGEARRIRYSDNGGEDDRSGNGPLETDIRLLCRESEAAYHALHGAIERRGEQGMGCGVWRAALLRFSSRPVDFVLSIMGLFGVALDPSRFAADDRVGATVALMQELLRKGHPPEWLGILPSLSPGRQLSMLPEFPEPGADGKVPDNFGFLAWWLEDMPSTASMDDEGCLRMAAPAVSVQLVSSRTRDDPLFETAEGRWALSSKGGSPQVYALRIGKKSYSLAGAYPTFVDPQMNVLLLVRESETGTYRCVGYANVEDEVVNLESWKTLTLSIK